MNVSMKRLLLPVLAVFVLFTAGYGQEIRLMTYNIRYDNPNDGENAWPVRRDVLVSQIRFYEPDVLGIQEGLEHQVQYMDEHLSAYKYAGVGRADLKEKGAGEFSAVFYNTHKFKLLKSGTFWLSETPEKPSRGWDASLNRICTYVLLENKTSEIRFWVFNTHFDHRGKEAREKSAELIVKKIGQINAERLPVFLMGDFNLAPGEAPVKYISTQLNDSHATSLQPPFGPEGTYNGFDVCKNSRRRIDYIFTGKEKVTVKKYAVLANVRDLKYPSDHFPVLVVAELK